MATNSSAVTGLWMKSVPGCRIAATARSTVGCAVTTTTGSVGSSRRTRSRNSSPLIRGISTSVITMSHGSDSMCLMPDIGSSTCWMAKPRDSSTLVAHRPKTRSSSISRTRTRGTAGVESAICPPSLSPSVPRGRPIPPMGPSARAEGPGYPGPLCSALRCGPPDGMTSAQSVMQ